MKKTYMIPGIDVVEVRVDTALAAVSNDTLDPDKDVQGVTPSDEEWNDEFGSRRNRDRWDDEEEDSGY